MHRALVISILILIAPLACAQGPSADWRTIETAHFRVHYPEEYEAWSLRAASRLESIREAVSKEIGFTPAQKTDVLVMNPFALPNGAALPLLDSPRMIFFAEPPGPDEQLGAYGHWIDLLAVHETAHVVHMLRPSRNPLERALEKSVLPLNPITLRAPRWALEGYATVIEGRLTGAGRPNSTLRALILRRWAQSGRMPSYAQLNSDRRFLGPSMAYLAGSAFLEWLEARSGPDALRNLWARLTARRRRSFHEAFAGVFGEAPDRLYGRFVAELTASAMTIDRAAALQQGELWQETSGATGEPAVSPDGSELAIVLRAREKPDRLVIWSTAAPDEEEKKYREQLDKILARDPEDVAPVRAKPLPRKAKHELVMPDGGDIVAPRWLPDGQSLLFSHRTTDSEGFLHWDLFRWTPSSGALRRITRGADVREADADGSAVRSRFGASQLVTVDLESGVVTPRGEASLDSVYSRPRRSPDGAHLAFIAHHRGAWKLQVDERVIEVDGDASSPAWISNDALIVTVSKGGFAELHRVTLDGASTPLTRTAGGAFDAAPAPDGRIFFTSLEPDGFVVRVLPPDAAPVASKHIFDATLFPAISPFSPPHGEKVAEGRMRGPKRYGLGRQEWSWLSAQNIAPDQRSFELGVRLGDVVGRLDTLLIASFSSGDLPEGAALTTAWRGWPIELHAHAFHADDENGAEGRARWTHRGALHRATLEAGALTNEYAFANASYARRQLRGAWQFDEAIRLDADDALRATASVAVRAGGMRVAARYQHDTGDVTLGGLPSSILPRSAYARRVLDAALPVATLRGERYDGWRIESTVPFLPFTAFYQRHELGGARLSLAGLELAQSIDPQPLVNSPGVDLTVGVARVFDGPLRDETKWWLGMRWRP